MTDHTPQFERAKNPQILKHVLDTAPDEIPKLHQVQHLATSLLIKARSLDLLDYLYHQTYSDLVLGVNKALLSHGVDQLAPSEDVQLVMSSSVGTSLYITGMPYARFIQVFAVCTEILLESLIRTSEILEQAQPISSGIESKYDMQTEAVKQARQEGIESAVDSYDLLTLYYIYLSKPTDTIKQRIEDLVLYKRANAVKVMSYEGYLRALARKFDDQIYYQPVLNSDKIEGYRLDKCKPVLAKHSHVITKAQNDAQTLYESISMSESMYPVTVNSVVKTVANRWYDYDQYSLRLGVTLQGVKQFTYEIDKLNGKFIEKSWQETDIRFCPAMFQVNVLRYLESREEIIKPLLLKTFKAFAISSTDVANAISDRLFSVTNYKPWLDTQLNNDLRLLFQTAESIGQADIAKKVKKLAINLRSGNADELAAPFLQLDCPVSKLLESVSPCNLRFDFIIVKPEYRLFESLIAALLVYNKVSKTAFEALTKQFLTQH